MKKLFFIIGLFFSLSAMAQPTNYTKINMRYRWLSGMFDSALYVPRYNGTPSGVRVNETSVFDGMVAMDTTNNRLYIYSGGAWVRLANYSEATYTAGNGLTLSGSQFKLGGTLSENTNIVVDNGFRMGFDLDPSDAIFSVSTNNSDTVLKIVNDNRIYLPQIFTVSSTTGRKVALIDTATGKVERIDPATLVTTPTLQQVLTAGSTLTGDFSVATNGEFGIESTGSGLSFLTAGATTQQSIINTTSVSLSSSTSSTFKSEVVIQRDSIYFLPGGGKLNIDSLRTWSGIADTTHKKPMTWDTRNGRWEYAANWPQQKINLVFGAGSGADADTTAFTTSAIYGSFYNDADTIVVTSMRAVLQGTSPDVTYKVWYNDSLNVEAGATALVTAGSQVTNTTTGTNVTSFDVTKIPPGVWVWVKTSTVATKPKYFSLTVNGYRK